MDHNRFVDIHVSEPDILSPLETNQQVDGGVSVEGRKRPDGVREAGIVVDLALFAVALVWVRRGERRVRFAEVVEVVVDETVVEPRAAEVFAQHAGVATVMTAERGGGAVGEESVLGEGFALSATGRFRQGGGDAGGGGAEEVGICGFEEGGGEGAEEALRVRDCGDGEGFLVDADGGEL